MKPIARHPGFQHKKTKISNRDSIHRNARCFVRSKKKCSRIFINTLLQSEKNKLVINVTKHVEENIIFDWTLHPTCVETTFNKEMSIIRHEYISEWAILELIKENSCLSEKINKMPDVEVQYNGFVASWTIFELAEEDVKEITEPIILVPKENGSVYIPDWAIFTDE